MSTQPDQQELFPVLVTTERSIYFGFARNRKNTPKGLGARDDEEIMNADHIRNAFVLILVAAGAVMILNFLESTGLLLRVL
jgi:hypothetical protein